MQIAVRLWWKASNYALHLAAGEVGLDQVANEIPDLFVRSGLRHRLLVIHVPVNLHSVHEQSAAKPIVALAARSARVTTIHGFPARWRAATVSIVPSVHPGSVKPEQQERRAACREHSILW